MYHWQTIKNEKSCVCSRTMATRPSFTFSPPTFLQICVCFMLGRRTFRLNIASLETRCSRNSILFDIGLLYHDLNNSSDQRTRVINMCIMFPDRWYDTHKNLEETALKSISSWFPSSFVQVLKIRIPNLASQDLPPINNHGCVKCVMETRLVIPQEM